MKRNLTIILIAIMFPLSIFSQISNEIATYVDSTELLVNNGRKMILKELADNNLVKTKEIYDFLTEKTKDKPFSAFYFIEDFYSATVANLQSEFFLWLMKNGMTVRCD